jgi:hypothetical protein
LEQQRLQEGELAVAPLRERHLRVEANDAAVALREVGQNTFAFLRCEFQRMSARPDSDGRIAVVQQRQ